MNSSRAFFILVLAAFGFGAACKNDGGRPIELPFSPTPTVPPPTPTAVPTPRPGAWMNNPNRVSPLDAPPRKK